MNQKQLAEAYKYNRKHFGRRAAAIGLEASLTTLKKKNSDERKSYTDAELFAILLLVRRGILKLELAQ